MARARRRSSVRHVHYQRIPLIPRAPKVFDEKGRNILRYRLRPDGRVAASWLDKDGHGRLDTVLRRVN